MAKKKKKEVFPLECATGAMAPDCGECVACDVAENIKAVVVKLKRWADEVDGTATEKRMLEAAADLKALVEASDL